jgi:murein L,D-transpeptidase YcbB/YkuD
MGAERRESLLAVRRARRYPDAMHRRDACLLIAGGLLPSARALAEIASPPVRPAAPPSWEAVFRLADRLEAVAADGLEPRAYAIPPRDSAAADPAGYHNGVYRAAHAVLGDLLGGVLPDPSSRPDIRREASPAALAAWHAELVAAAEPAQVVERAATLPAETAPIRAELARARALVAAGGWPTIPAGGTIEPGSVDEARIPALRARLAAEDPVLAAAPDGGALYDEPLQAAVQRWQAATGLEVDGRVGAISQRLLNRPASDRVAQLRVALDMRRAAERPGPDRRIEVNIPEYRLRMHEAGRTLIDMAVVVGRVGRATPMMRVRMTTAQFNPPWGVPERNAREDLLPKFRRDPRAMMDKGFRLYTYVGGERIEVDPMTVDWAAVSSTRFPYYVRQDSGDGNALGRIKFIMPNNDDIYLHDTPDRQYFRRPDRAFSSGCIRLEKPMELLDLVLDGTPGWDRARVDKALSTRDTSAVGLRRPVPVRLHYTTTVVEAGRVRVLPDIYGHDAAYARAMDARHLRVAARN